jgi:hypothetical protein
MGISAEKWQGINNNFPELIGIFKYCIIGSAQHTGLEPKINITSIFTRLAFFINNE